jgi:hypothetical protein
VLRAFRLGNAPVEQEVAMSEFERRQRLRWGLGLLLVCAGGCDAIGSFAVEAGDFAGATADVSCDRRYVSDGGTPAAFCQEVIATVAASEFADDCRAKHKATAAPGRCPRARIIAGCKLLKVNDDKSLVWDWYYDVSDIAADSGAHAALDGGPSPGPSPGSVFESRPRSVQEVAAFCADRSRYEQGAELDKP